MATNNIEILEDMMTSAINSTYIDYPPTEEEFIVEINKLREMTAQYYPVTDDEFKIITRKVRASVVVRTNRGILIKNKAPHVPWLTSRREEIDFFFWNRYRKYLAHVKHWNPRSIGNLGLMSDDIVDYLGDPQSAEPFQRRGLLWGDVQSGKTAAYTAICNKAADTGYRVIIVLTGITEDLRQQTQERLDMEFAGRKSEYIIDSKHEIENEIVGVGRYGTEKRIDTFTSVAKDFDKNIRRTLDLSLDSVTSTVLFVIKKNRKILENLIRWLGSSLDDNRFINQPLLLIDDEADNASINTNDEEDPTRINDAIRRLLKLFRQASYLGVTATPYANIFINPDLDDNDIRAEDLFPRDFIYFHNPPDNYIGAERIFGDDDEFTDTLVPLYPQEMDAFFPFNHKKNTEVDELPPSMYEAMAYFVLLNGVRDIRGDNKEHRSMMIHVSRFIDVQNQICALVHIWIENIRSDLQNYSNLSEFESDKISNISFLKSVYNKYKLNEKAGTSENPMTWHEFLSKYLYKAASPIEARSVNMQSGTGGLNYYIYKDNGLRVIAVGGNRFSRGLTLEGLCVSYFYRKSLMYDTLLQMGRWFGYRPGYKDLFKIWISIDAISWYDYITTATAELKTEISRMHNANLTPNEFGLKVRQDPASLLIAAKLIITAKNKMRTATQVKRPVTITGSLLETPRLKISTLYDNERVIKSFIGKLDDYGNRTIVDGARYFWKGVNKRHIANLLRNFKTHLWHQSFQGEALADYIDEKMNDLAWDVFIAEGDKANKEYNEILCGEVTLPIYPERRVVLANKDQICISGTKVRVGTVGATRIGLSIDERKEAERKFREENDAKSIPDRAYLIKGRNPLLILHVIMVDRTSNEEGVFRTQIESGVIIPDILFALGVGFPSTGEKEETANYMINLVEFRNSFDVMDGIDE